MKTNYREVKKENICDRCRHLAMFRYDVISQNGGMMIPNMPAWYCTHGIDTGHIKEIDPARFITTHHVCDDYEAAND